MRNLGQSIELEGSGCTESISAEPTILVVEDDDDVRTLVVELLESRNYNVIPAPDAAHALVILTGSVPIDLLFTDIVMPGALNGAELAQEAQRVRPGLKVLYTSGFVGHPAPRLAPVRSANNFVEKPYRPAKLIERVQAMLSA